MILIAGPYRSGTGDDPDLLAANLRALEEAAWPVFRAGHVPMIGEWVALPVMRGAGSTGVGDPVSEKVLYRVRIARERSLPVYERIEDVPGYAAPVLEQA